ncbi:hypothetical protein O0I10_008500 [Lichtheimia ornata]|uniref:Methyltransferase type 11 domain-containing protein n=1 Tax=Lichtheimia ornata TaxID=688661 RepID=A0AAD7XWX8_9FUNG|nr:uncharacterized protein O0I10_008500 [Lichtheimia ornata]KAJ8655836.1 hypothetical protein O0I10_008500 [Lichtheimia ornata]
MANVHPTAIAGFNVAADDYAKSRPSYPTAALDHIKSLVPDTDHAKILDLAAGTGIMTILLDKVGYKHITAVEPTENMREKLHSLLPHVPVFDGTSWSIPLEDQSQDAVIVAQAFHWFADVASLKEMHRVLKPNGVLILIWNMESGEKSKWVRLLKERYQQLDQDVPQYRKGEWKQCFDTKEAAELFELPFQQRMFDYDMTIHKDHVCRRVMTKSYVASLPDDVKEALYKELEAIVQDPANEFKPNADGYVIYPHDTEVVWMKKK